MDAQTIVGLLTPSIGKSGRVLVLRRGSSALQSLTTDKLALTRVELRPDGLIQTWHDRGWDVSTRLTWSPLTGWVTRGQAEDSTSDLPLVPARPNWPVMSLRVGSG